MFRHLLAPAFVVLIASAVVAAQRASSAGSPFGDFLGVDGVTLSGDAYSIWISWEPDSFTIRYPDGRAPFDHDEPAPNEPGGLYSVLNIYCRANGRSSGFSGSSPLSASLLLPMHPQAPPAYSVIHPMHWILELVGRAEQRTPVRVHLPADPVFHADLVQRRVDWSFPRPDVRLDLPPSRILGLLVAASPLHLRAVGDGVDIDVRLPAAPHLAVPARRALAHCIDR